MEQKPVPNPQTGEVKLFVGNLPSNITQEDVTSLFVGFGNLVEAFLLKRRSTSGRQCAFVQFKTQESADAAIEALHGYVMDSCALAVCSVPSPQTLAITSSILHAPTPHRTEAVVL